MVRVPQGRFAKIPGFETVFKASTLVLPLRRGTVAERNGTVYGKYPGRMRAGVLKLAQLSVGMSKESPRSCGRGLSGF